jgi:hypothetical protein
VRPESAVREATRAAIRGHLLPEGPDPGAAAVARQVAEKAGAVRAVLFFGSRKTRARPDAYSAHDFFVLTADYRGFYDGLRRSGSLRRPPALVAALNAVLPPNQVSIPATLDDGTAARGKCAVVTLRRFERETSRGRSDHFILGRTFQPTELAYAADAEARDRVAEAVVRSHALTYLWSRPWLPETFDAADYCRTLLRVSFAAEIRPEPEGRAQALWEAQEAYLRPVYASLLSDLAAAGELREVGPPGTYALVHPATRGERLRLAAYFRWSLVRATVRWAKYMVTFEDWLEFIVRKARRHTGQDIVLTPRERRLPLVFLWPRVIQYLRHKDRRP